jgi:hypothetical protein
VTFDHNRMGQLHLRELRKTVLHVHVGYTLR